MTRLVLWTTEIQREKSLKGWPWSLCPAQCLPLVTWSSVLSDPAPVSCSSTPMPWLCYICLDFSSFTLLHLPDPSIHPDAHMCLGIILNCFSLKHICLDLKYTSNPNMYYFLLPPWSTMASLQGSHSLLFAGFPEAQVHPWYPTSFHTVPEGS